MGQVTIQWHEVEYPAPEEGEEDYCPAPEEIDRGEEVLDEYIDEGRELWQEVAEYLRDEGAVLASSYPQWCPGTWYHTESEQDYRTGAYTQRSYHIAEGADLTEADLQAIYQRVTS